MISIFFKAIQVNLHTVTTAFISLSFAFRLISVINNTPTTKVVNVGAFWIIAINIPCAFGNFMTMERGETPAVSINARNIQAAL
ncbi:hypothetical protein PENTCL1PPCAC_16553, partial [Pristionchus entomophagus]